MKLNINFEIEIEQKFWKMEQTKKNKKEAKDEKIKDQKLEEQVNLEL